MNDTEWLTEVVDSAEPVDGYSEVRRVFLDDYKDAIRLCRGLVFINETGRPIADEIQATLRRGSARLIAGRASNGQLLGSWVAVFFRDNNPMGTRRVKLHFFVSANGSEEDLSECAEAVFKQYKEILDARQVA